MPKLSAEIIAAPNKQNEDPRSPLKKQMDAFLDKLNEIVQRLKGAEEMLIKESLYSREPPEALIIILEENQTETGSAAVLTWEFKIEDEKLRITKNMTTVGQGKWSFDNVFESVYALGAAGLVREETLRALTDDIAEEINVDLVRL